MRNSVFIWIAVAVALLVGTPLSAQPSGALTLDEVLQSSRRHAPAILDAVARVRAAEGRRLSADGAFDTTIAAEASGRLSGFYDGKLIGATITRPIENWGGSLYGGYRVSDGRFPVYEDRSFTNVLGELKVGALFSLLRDRLIDDRRFGRADAGIEVEIAQADRQFTAIGVQRRALAAYNGWVAAGLRLGVYRDLLALAEARQGGLQRQVALGARPRILITENEQNILRRQTLVARAEQELDNASNLLSLFLRDAGGVPVRVSAARLPPTLPSAPPSPADPVAMAAARPDLKILDLRQQQAGNRVSLAQNALLPKLDVRAEIARDLGPIGAGGASRVGTETILGLNFTMPLQRRAARGRVAQGLAEMDSIARKRQQLEEQIGVELEAIAIDVRATEKLRQLAEAEQARASDLAQAERRRFALGSSDFFLVNTREEAAADAAVRQLDARYRHLLAQAERAAAAGDLRALGLE